MKNSNNKYVPEKIRMGFLMVMFRSRNNPQLHLQSTNSALGFFNFSHLESFGGLINLSTASRRKKNHLCIVFFKKNKSNFQKFTIVQDIFLSGFFLVTKRIIILVTKRIIISPTWKKIVKSLFKRIPEINSKPII